jgi:RHS repeat-associated protein
MKRNLIILMFFLVAGTAHGQFPSGTGFPPFSSIQSFGIGSLNLQNLNFNFAVPLPASGGRGTNLTMGVSYNSLIWSPQGPGVSWTPVVDPGGNPTWGWSLNSPIGSIPYQYVIGECFYISGGQGHYAPVYTYNYYYYVEPNGTMHPFNVKHQVISSPCTGAGTYGPFTGYATDNSGFFIDITTPTSPKVYSPSGTQITTGILKDSNGNYISDTVVNSSETDWTDSVGRTALKIITSSSSIKYEYLDPTGVYQTITLALTSQYIRTNFGCSGVGEYAGTASLPSSLTFPNGWVYSFTYEATPGHSGDVTGRLSKIALPNGGYVQLSYGTTHDAIDCTTGNTINLTKTDNDGTTSYSWQFVNTGGTGSTTTTITAPQMPYDSAPNQSVYAFNSSGQETSAAFYQGASTLLRTVNTTWASNNTPAAKTTILEDNSTQSEIETSYDTYGNLLSLKEHDYGTGAPGSVLRTTTYTYLNSSAYTNLNIMNRVTEKSVADSTGTVQYVEDTAYDGTTISPCPTGVVQHDDTNYPCSFTTRGNPSSVTTYTNASAKTGGVTKNSYYDVFGNLVQAALNCCQTKSWTFSSTTQYSYPDSDTCGATGGPQLTTGYTYNAYTGQKVSETDANNQVTSYTYDLMRRETSITRPDNSQISYTYADSQNQIIETDPIQGSVVRKKTDSLDGLGRVVKRTTTDASGNTYAISQKVFDGLGRGYQVANPYLSSPQYWASTQYDAAGRITKNVLQDGEQIQYAYSAASVTTTDPAGNLSKFQADGLGRVIIAFEPDVTNNNSLTLQTSYTYTVLGEQATITQGSQARSFNYDGMGRLTSETTPEAGTVSNQYDNFNNLTQRTDARGVITNYSYDTLNRLTQTSYNVGTTGVASTPTVAYTYGTTPSQNNNGRLITMTDGTGSESYSYDILGRTTQLQKVLGGTTYTTSYQYNQAGNVTSTTYPSQKVIQKNYDAIGRPSSIANGTSSIVSALAYNTNFQLTGFTYGNGISASQTFSADRAQLTGVSYTGTNGTIFGLTYSHAQSGGNNGEIASTTDSFDSGRSATYTYDALGRLSTATTAGSTNYPQWGLSFTYDRYGNRTNQTVTAGTAYANSVVVNAATNQITTLGYGYDASGNMTSDGVNTLTYDAENRVLTSADGSGSGGYSYDGNGLRVQKTSSGATTLYLYDGTNVIAEYASGASPSSPTIEYLYLGNRLMSQIQSGATSYYHADHLSPRVMTDSNGNVLQQQGHYPFGEQWYPTGTGTSPEWKFTNYERDVESGNDYAKFRYGVNRLGRFLTGDPVRSVKTIDPQRSNRYSYVANDPINRTDPSGRFIAPICVIENNLEYDVIGGIGDTDVNLELYPYEVVPYCPGLLETAPEPLPDKTYRTAVSTYKFQSVKFFICTYRIDCGKSQNSCGSDTVRMPAPCPKEFLILFFLVVREGMNSECETFGPAKPSSTAVPCS